MTSSAAPGESPGGRSRRSGFTLIEVLVSVVVISVGVVAVLQALSRSAVALDNARNAIAAQTLIRQHMADLAVSIGEEGPLPSGSSTVRVGNRTYIVQVRLDAISTATGADGLQDTLYRATVSVSRQGTPQQYSAVSCFRRTIPGRTAP